MPFRETLAWYYLPPLPNSHAHTFLPQSHTLEAAATFSYFSLFRSKFSTKLSSPPRCHNSPSSMIFRSLPRFWRNSNLMMQRGCIPLACTCRCFCIFEFSRPSSYISRIPQGQKPKDVCDHHCPGENVELNNQINKITVCK